MLGLQALEAEAFLGMRRLVELLEHLHEVLDVALGLPEVLLERVPKLVVRDLADQFRQHLVGELPLDVEDVAELVEEQLARRGDLAHPWLLSCGCSRPYPYGPPRNRSTRLPATPASAQAR